jgi:two-component system, NarL family, nitrate/nitrite response regulator NarL
VSSKATIRVLIADDHRLFRDGLRRLFDGDAGFAVVGEASDGPQAIRFAEDAKPDVALLDVAMPGMSDFEALRELPVRSPGVRPILLTAGIEKPQMMTALQLGARGVIMKNSAPAVLFKCIRAVIAGQYWLERSSVADLVELLRRLAEDAREDQKRSRFGLTRRELEIVAAVAAGDTNKGIAERLQLSEDTVKHHLTHVFDKLGVFTRLELALYAINHGLLPSDTPPAPRPNAG